jgi:hypothetical protein
MTTSTLQRALRLRGLPWLLLLFGLSLPPASVAEPDWSRLSGEIAGWLDDGSLVPSGVRELAAGSGAAPLTVQVTLLTFCRKVMAEAARELAGGDLAPAWQEALMLRYEKASRLSDALTGKPAPLRALLHDLDAGRPVENFSYTASMQVEEAAFLDDLIARYQVRLKSLLAEAERAWEPVEPARAQAREAYEMLIDRLNDLKLHSETFKATAGKIQALCDFGRELERAIMAYGGRAGELAERANARLTTARNAVVTCRSSADADAIRAAYHAAEGEVAESRIALGQAQRLVDAYRENRTEVADGREVMAKMQRNNADIASRLPTSDPVIADWRTKEATWRAARQQLERLMSDVWRIRQDYRNDFPARMRQVDTMLGDASKSGLLDKPEALVLDWYSARQQAEADAQSLIGRPIPACAPSVVDVDALQASAARAFDSAFVALQVSEYVLAKVDACANAANSAPPVLPLAPPIAAMGPTPATPAVPSPTPAASVPPSPTSGNLRIVGPGVLIARVGGRFDAADEAGNLDDRGVTWNTSAEDVLSVGSQGLAIAHKAGTVTVLAIRGGQSAFKTVEVKARVPDLVGLSLRQARQELRALGLLGQPGDHAMPESALVGGQSVAPGTLASAGASVVLSAADKPPVYAGGTPDTPTGGGFASLGAGAEQDLSVPNPGVGSESSIATQDDQGSTPGGGVAHTSQGSIFSDLGGTALDLLGQGAFPSFDESRSSQQAPSVAPDEAGTSSGATPGVKTVGAYLFAEMSQFQPPEAEQVFARYYPEDARSNSPERFLYSYRKALRTAGSIDHNPGFWADVSRGLTPARKSAWLNCKGGRDLRVVDQGVLNTAEGPAAFCVLESHGETHLSRLVWGDGDWALRMSGWDRPANPASVFGPSRGVVKYMSRVLGYLQPRLREALSGAVVDDAQQTPGPGHQPGGVELLGVEAAR